MNDKKKIVTTMFVKNYEDIRRVMALLMAGLVLLFTFHISYLGICFDSIKENLNTMQVHEEESLERFLDLSITVEERQFKTLQELWYDLSEIYTNDQVLIDRFSSITFDSFLESAVLSVIVLQDGEKIIRIAYKNPLYEEMEDLLWGMPFGDRKIILNGEADIPFGKGERIFLVGDRLQTPEGKYIYLYLGFYEPVRIGGFINALESSALRDAKESIESSMYRAILSMILFIVYGYAMLYILRRLSRKTAISFLENNQVQLCGDTVLGRILIEKGYVTISQLADCLNEQANRRKNGDIDE